MPLIYQRASLAQLELLVKTRIHTLLAANNLPAETDMSEIACSTRTYYQTALADGSHTAYLVFDGDNVVGTGGLSYFQVMPTCHNPSGRKAYLMNLYTAPLYRRRGVASQVLRLLLEDARAKGVTAVSLEATAMGRPLYEEFDFVPMENEMELLLKEKQ